MVMRKVGVRYRRVGAPLTLCRHLKLRGVGVGRSRDGRLLTVRGVGSSRQRWRLHSVHLRRRESLRKGEGEMMKQLQGDEHCQEGEHDGRAMSTPTLGKQAAEGVEERGVPLPTQGSG